jgi:hypothetical protein
MRSERRSADHFDMASYSSVGTSCPSCRSKEIMTVRLALGEGTPLAFDFCTRCEWRGWDAEGQNLPLSSILGLAARR